MIAHVKVRAVPVKRTFLSACGCSRFDSERMICTTGIPSPNVGYYTVPLTPAVYVLTIACQLVSEKNYVRSSRRIVSSL